MTLLTIVSNACDKIGLPRPSAVIASQDQSFRELLSFAQQEGDELAKAVPWQEITKETSFTTIAAYAQTNSIPSDWDRFVNGSMYNRTLQRKMHGPITPQEWQQRLAFPASSTVEWWFRVRGGEILIHPLPPAGNSVYYEYISNQWVDTNADGVGDSATWTADSNTAVIPEDLITLGVVYRFLRAKGLATWEMAFQQYRDQVAKKAVQQEGSPVLQTVRRGFYSGAANVPEGNWP